MNFRKLLWLLLGSIIFVLACNKGDEGKSVNDFNHIKGWWSLTHFKTYGLKNGDTVHQNLFIDTGVSSFRFYDDSSFLFVNRCYTTAFGTFQEVCAGGFVVKNDSVFLTPLPTLNLQKMEGGIEELTDSLLVLRLNVASEDEPDGEIKIYRFLSYRRVR